MDKSLFFCLNLLVLFTATGINEQGVTKFKQTFFYSIFISSCKLKRSVVLCEEHDGHRQEFKVFHVEWERVEVPYAVGLWIIITALIKVCKSQHRRYNDVTLGLFEGNRENLCVDLYF